MNSLMSLQVAFLGKPFPTVCADVRSLTSVNPAVCFQVTQFGETPSTDGTAELPLTCVNLLVSSEVAQMREAFPALAAIVHRLC